MLLEKRPRELGTVRHACNLAFNSLVHQGYKQDLITKSKVRRKEKSMQGANRMAQVTGTLAWWPEFLL